MTPATESDTGRRRLLSFSVGLNALLAAALLFLGPSRPRESLALPADSLPPEGTSSTPASPRNTNARPSKVTPGREPTPWSRLISADLREYATNLRLAGCPAETICDLLRPEGKLALAIRTEAARYHTNFWLSGAQQAAHNRAVQAQASRWQQEQVELLAELGCVVEWPEEEGLQVDLVLRVAAGFLPRERQLALLDLFLVGVQLRERWRERTEGVVLPADLQWLAAESQQFTQRFRHVLSAADFEEVCLRAVALLEGRAVPDDAAAAGGITPAEFRELLRRSFLAGENELERVFHWERMLAEEERPSRSDAQRDADQREVLGEARAEELRLRSGPTYAITREWADKYGLDATAPRRVFATLEQFQQAVAALAEAGREQTDAVKADFQAAHQAALAGLEQSLSRVPATNRTEQLRHWLFQAAQDGWRQP